MQSNTRLWADTKWFRHRWISVARWHKVPKNITCQTAKHAINTHNIKNNKKYLNNS